MCCETPGGEARGTTGTQAGTLFKASLGEWMEARRKRSAEGRLSGEPGFQYFLLNCEPLAHGPASTHVTWDVSDGRVPPCGAGAAEKDGVCAGQGA